MYELAKVAGFLLSPWNLAMGLGLLSLLCLLLRRRRTALGLALLAFSGLWVSSLPVTAQALAGALERRYPALPAHAAPAADAIVILGGSVAGRHPPRRPALALNSASSRVWYAAELYRAGKARWVVIAAGGEPDFPDQQAEADAIAEMLAVLGVPPQAIRREAESRNTRENAANIRPILDRLGARRVLLVTSAQHMPRAVKTFEKTWPNTAIAVVPAPTDVQVVATRFGPFMWIPSLYALEVVTRAAKEYAGMAVLAII